MAAALGLGAAKKEVGTAGLLGDDGLTMIRGAWEP